MTDPTTGPNDDALDAALRAMTRPVVDPARREMHIANALAALDAAGSNGIEVDNVVSLASRRRPRLMALTAVAAAGLFVVGLGIGRVSAPNAPSPAADVKNAALTPAAPNGTVDGCPDLVFDQPFEVVTTFGTYALYRTGGSVADAASAATLVVVDTATCSIVTRITPPANGG